MAPRYGSTRWAAFALLPLLTWLTACDQGALEPPVAEAGGPMFARYAALGNSITAGFQSGGINDSTQLESYVVLLAQQAGLTIGREFFVPLLQSPGCPPPLTDVFTQTRLMGLGGSDCFLRRPPISPYINNVAVPGAAVIDALTNLDPESDPNPLTTVFLGGRTQLTTLTEIEPTFVTVWIGNNDALGAVLAVGDAGDPGLVTNPADFAAEYGQMMDALDAIGTIQGGALIGVVQVGLAPYLTQGRAWAGFEQQFDLLTAPLNALDVDLACLANMVLPTGDTAWTAVPFHYGAPVLASANAKIDSVQQGLLAPQNLQPARIDCTNGDVITQFEMANMMGAVAAYNATIETEAADRGWIFLDPNDLLIQLAADPTQIRPVPAFNPADPQHETAPFGTALSRDGVHPSASSHVLVANALIAAINATYSLNIPAVP